MVSTKEDDRLSPRWVKWIKVVSAGLFALNGVLDLVTHLLSFWH